MLRNQYASPRTHCRSWVDDWADLRTADSFAFGMNLARSKKTPAKTRVELRKLWCAILGSNQRSPSFDSMLSPAKIASPPGDICLFGMDNRERKRTQIAPRQFMNSSRMGKQWHGVRVGRPVDPARSDQ
jgi:hypothetical protein